MKNHSDVRGTSDTSHEVERIPVLILSRMTSRRLPGKALRLIKGKPLIQWVIESCAASEGVSGVFVATSTDPSDLSLREWCETAGVGCVVGPLHDCLKRVEVAASALSCEALIRVSGDSPIIDPKLIDFALRIFRTSDSDLVTNVQFRTFPRGQSVEVLRSDLVGQLTSKHLPATHREHVTSAVYEGLVEARVLNFTSQEVAPSFVQSMSSRGINLSDVNLSVDTLEDAESITEIVRSLYPTTPTQAGWVGCTEMFIATRTGQP